MKDNMKLYISAIASYGNEYICFAKNINVLFSLDKKGDIKCLCFIPEKGRDRLFDKIVIYRDRVFLIPLMAKKIYIYNLDSKKLEFIELNNAHIARWNFFYNGIELDGFLYLIGACYHALVKIDLNSLRVEEIPIYESKMEIQSKLNDCFSRKSIVEMDKKIYIASALSNEVLVYDTISNSYVWKKIASDTNRYSGIAWDGKAFWLAPRDNYILVRWEPNISVEEFDISQWYEDDKFFAGIVCKKDKVYLYSYQAEKSFVYDYINKCGSKIVTGPECLFENDRGKEIYQYVDGSVCVDEEDDKEKIDINLNDLYQIISSREDKWSYYMNENQTFGLDVFIEELIKS